MAEVTEAVIDAAAETADKVVEETDHIAEVSGRLSGRELRLLLAGVGVGAVAVAVAASIHERKLRKQYAEQAEAEIDQMREHFRARLVARDEKPSLQDFEKVVDEAGYSTARKVDDYTKASEVISEMNLEKPDLAVPFEELEPKVRNIFENQSQIAVPSEDGWNYETELAKRVTNRDTDRPYVIHADEQRELDYTETEFTYYEGDDVVLDSEDRIVKQTDALLGVDFREKFGHGSGDSNTVYIRNDVISVDIEVTRVSGMFSVEVLGLGDPEEDEDPRSRKVNFDDDD